MKIEQIIMALDAGHWQHDQEYGTEPRTVAEAIECLFEQTRMLALQVRELQQEQTATNKVLRDLSDIHP